MSASARATGGRSSRSLPEGLTLLAEQAFHDVAFLLAAVASRSSCAAILKDPESSANDRYVALEMLKNAVISAEGVFPMCQDTGTAIINAKKGQRVWTGGGDEEALSRGVFNAYTENYFRYSQNAALTMYDEKNTGSNLPAQIDIAAVDGDAYGFLFIAKGGGSANKTYLFQETKAVLNPDALQKFLIGKMKAIGTAACPPYHLAVVVGGTSAELVLKTVKLASASYLDALPTQGGPGGHAFRDVELEARLLEASRKIGLGAQFGGKYFCLDVRVIRLPRHGASCPIGMGVSCNADRNVKAKITRDGIFLERLEKDPASYLPEPAAADEDAVRDRSQPSDERDPGDAQQVPRGDAAVAQRSDHRRPRHRPRPSQGKSRQGRGPAGLFQGPYHLLRRSGQDAARLRLGLPRADDGRPHGRLCPPLPEAGRLRSSCWPRETAPRA